MEIQLNQVVYRIYNGRPTEKYVIDRVTKTIAEAGNTQFRRESRSNGGVLLKNQPTWGSSYFEISTPELDALYEEVCMRQRMKSIYDSTDKNKLNKNQCERIITILQEPPNV